MIHDGAGFKVYSLGVDRRDDKGTVEERQTDKARNDIVFAWDGKQASLKGR